MPQRGVERKSEQAKTSSRSAPARGHRPHRHAAARGHLDPACTSVVRRKDGQPLTPEDLAMVLALAKQIDPQCKIMTMPY